MAAGETALLCRVSNRVCALPLTHIRETMRPLPIEPLAGVAPPVSGVAIIRGAPVPVLDMGRLLGGTEAQPQRFVTLRLGDRSIALAVDAVVGIRTIPAEAGHALPPLVREADAEAIARIGTLDAELLLVLQDTRLLPDTAWEALEHTDSEPGRELRPEPLAAFPAESAAEPPAVPALPPPAVGND